MTAPDLPWSIRIPLSDLRRGPITRDLTPDAGVQGAIAQALQLAELKGLSARVRLTPWHDGVELSGEWAAVVTQVCGVSLDPFETPLSGAFQVRCAPLGSELLTQPESELEIDLDADDPPDALEQDWIDVAAYVVEHLALDIDPFPRKPGVEFVPPPAETPASPFAVLARLRPADTALKPEESGSGD
jgi:uncharacterized metal-binding protein YceD (DUF177 family)